MADLSSLAGALAATSTQPTTAARERMLDAARAEFIAHGIARTSVATIAQCAGVSRPTLYRQCGDKDQIIAAVVQRDVIDFFARAKGAVDAFGSAEDRVTEAVVMGLRESREHPLVQALKTFETDSFTARLVDMDTPTYRAMLAIIATMFADDEYRPAMLERALDVALRIIATLLITPSPYVPTDNDDSARAFANRYLVPILRASR
ncbi:TetR family transcriptional regulator [Mycobacterium sp. CBMA 234]|uniref:TetR/AcrR family transcriptional regulator n=1 Tax=Mycolicibacterium sp. CBMA 234 TaxID=1918495 RepID=UPI0012DCC6EC|nr:TetR/AcrR family transcriptional regulator [Mycolicibacterium sp. CBMA 234]MUL67469.1 TetR family transcriptional regulator [Mycolicibacterium sp. CBMA 234]